MHALSIMVDRPTGARGTPSDWRSFVRTRTPRRIAFGPLLRERLTQLLDEGSPSTSDWRSAGRRLVNAFGALQCEDLAQHPDWVDAWLRALGAEGLAPASREKLKSLLSHFCRYAVETGAMSQNPVRLCEERPGRAAVDPMRSELEVLDPADLTRLAFDSRIPLERRHLWRVLLLTGCRIGEAGALSWGDVDERELIIRRTWDSKSGRLIERTKTGLHRHVPLVELRGLLDEARWWVGRVLGRDVLPTDPLCPYLYAGEVRRWSERTALNRWHDDQAAVGIARPAAGPRRLHSTRHTFVSLLINRWGAQERSVRMITHCDPKTGRDAFERYVHGYWPALVEAVSKFTFDAAVRAEVSR